MTGIGPGIGPEIAGAIGLVVGVAIGLLVMRLGGRDWRSRIRALEAEYRDEREAHAAYRASVSKHFADTSDLFRDLTRQYTALYAHLAEGARGLCPENPPALASGYHAEDPVLPPRFESAAAAPALTEPDLPSEEPAPEPADRRRDVESGSAELAEAELSEESEDRAPA
jgi:uncharacterized membrane-anchored protein YhcB (DUF1043 family)